MSEVEVGVGKRQNDQRDHRVPADQEVTGEKIKSRPKRGRQRSYTSAVGNVPVQKPQITKTDPEKRNFGALRTGDSGKGPKKTGQKSSSK